MNTCNLGQISPGAARFFGQNWWSAWQKMCGWLKIPCTIPTPGFTVLVCESILTLQCICISLQSCTHVIWARLALKLSILGQLWGLAWHQMMCLDEKAMCDSHPRLYNYKPYLWTNFDFGMLLHQPETICTCHLGQISPGAARFRPKLGVSLAENVVVCFKRHP